MILVLFLVAGLLFGGAWSAYQQGSKFFTIVAAVLGAVSIAAALAWMFGVMGQ
ncbi:hypothetical protein QP414_02625 [Corynebacterium simulans]|uniref:Membrane protein n=1 Tax=Corynebacterium simulans TaxID=146827 RepID=A0ABR5V956_9CORY|nr:MULTISPECIES: hypothetical protein [Corynebacterium]AMO90024.1 putative membrane protein [Corynebacterium simulans]AMO92580.1 putative membrane protein [Corynebacterium simulans]KXU18007.1 putative membrane protein [Corynebacterium simulans]MCG7246400.1 hypothetical protein [Corynebacterium simulans]MDK7138201.1 hypothetical protein [Corynebacterium simulans]